MEGGRRWIFSYSSDMWALGVIGMMKNMELYQTFSGGAAPRWSSVDLQLQSYVFRAGALPNTPLVKKIEIFMVYL
jgi:hypothetical protein